MVNAYVPSSAAYRQGYERFFVANAGAFYDIATKYGFNPIFIFCIGIHESGFGTSQIALDKGNFFGWGAYDGSPYDSAIPFYDMSAGIEAVCKGLAKEYVSESGMWYNWIKERGYEPTSIEGIGCRYASDGNWANAVKGHMKAIFGYTSNNKSQQQVNNNWDLGYTETYGKYKLYKQARGSYVGQPYNAVENNSTIAVSGCCPTSMAIVASGYGIDVDPGEMADLMGGIRTSGNSNAINAARVFNKLGLNSTGYYNVNEKSLRDHLLTGNALIVSVTGEPFSSGGHIIALLAIDEKTNKVFVGQSNNRKSGWYNLSDVMRSAKWWTSVSK